jgi:hypothetical protein
LQSCKLRFSGEFMATWGSGFGLLEPKVVSKAAATEPKVRGSNPLGRALRIPVLEGISGHRRTPRGGNSGGNRATLMVLPLEPTGVPGVYQRGSKFVVVYRAEGRQRKQSVDTLAEARVIKLQRDGEARAQRRGPTLHAFSLSCLTATPDRDTTACGPTPAASTGGSWSTSR